MKLILLFCLCLAGVNVVGDELAESYKFQNRIYSQTNQMAAQLRMSLSNISSKISVKVEPGTFFIVENTRREVVKEKGSGLGLQGYELDVPTRRGFVISVSVRSGVYLNALSRTLDPYFYKTPESKIKERDFYRAYTRVTIPEPQAYIIMDCYYGASMDTQKLHRVYSAVRSNLVESVKALGRAAEQK